MTTVLHDLYAVAWLATWGNNTAWLESLILTGLALWLGRDHIGRKAAAWWDRHHGEHAVRRHRQALEEHEAAKRKDGP